jgi:hypothetical protein
MVHAKQSYKDGAAKTYAMDPQVNPTKRYLPSLIDSADGAPSPVVSSFTGIGLCLLLHLKRALEVEK